MKSTFPQVCYWLCSCNNYDFFIDDDDTDDDDIDDDAYDIDDNNYDADIVFDINRSID